MTNWFDQINESFPSLPTLDVHPCLISDYLHQSVTLNAYVRTVGSTLEALLPCSRLFCTDPHSVGQAASGSDYYRTGTGRDTVEIR
jgi:hypothetical protein